MKLLLKIRLSWFFVFFLVLYLLLAYFIEGVTFEPGALTLFSVNSFLYGFYIAPVLSAQKTRIDELNKIIRAEASAMFDLLLKTKKLPAQVRNRMQDMFEAYIDASVRQRKPGEGEAQYQQLITYCLNYEGKNAEQVEKILTGLVANQSNRSQLAMQLRNKVFSNEWLIMLVLFSITLGFVLFLNINNPIMVPVKALLCTGLTMLMINLLKLSTLTHKKAKNIWDPLRKLANTRFYRVD
jgi:hypothetical protein